MRDIRGYGADLLTRLPAPRKVAVLRAARLGDFICATPALRALSRALPHAEIVMITLPALHDLVIRSPYLDRYAPFPGFPGIAEQLFEARAAVELLRSLQAERFDLAVQLQGTGVYSNTFTRLLGARVTVGFVRAEDPPDQLDSALVWPEHGHEIDRLLALMQHLGIPPCGRDIEFPLFPEDERAAVDLLAHLPRPLIGIHPGSHDPARRWPAERFAAVARCLLRRYGGVALLFGDGDELPATRELAAAIGPGAHSLAGRTPLPILAALISRLCLFLTNDTGPAHIAYALGTPTVAMYRTAGTLRYGPPATGPIHALEPGPGDAMVSVIQARTAAEELLSQPLQTGVDASLSWSSLKQSAR
jgi:ADP-heptose:LPS heptosyltransferase